MKKITNDFGFLDISSLDTVAYDDVSENFKTDIPLIGVIVESCGDEGRLKDSIDIRLQQVVLSVLSSDKPDEYLKELHFTGTKQKNMYLFAENNPDNEELEFVRTTSKIRDSAGVVHCPWTKGTKAYVGEGAIKIAYRSAKEELLTRIQDYTVVHSFANGIMEGFVYRDKYSHHNRVIAGVYAYPVFDSSNIYVER